MSVPTIPTFLNSNVVFCSRQMTSTGFSLMLTGATMMSPYALRSPAAFRCSR